MFVATDAKFLRFQPSRCVTAILTCGVSRNTRGFVAVASLFASTNCTCQSSGYPRIFTFGHKINCIIIRFFFFEGGGSQVDPDLFERDYSESFNNNI